MDIKEGEYVRTRRNGICKLFDAEIDGSGFWCGYTDKPFWLRKDNIKKHSKNIIDLIEVGDYVNGKRINDIEKFDNGTIYIKHSEHDYICDYQQEKIKSIVTKEQFKSIEYEV